MPTLSVTIHSGSEKIERQTIAFISLSCSLLVSTLRYSIIYLFSVVGHDLLILKLKRNILLLLDNQVSTFHLCGKCEMVSNARNFLPTFEEQINFEN